MRAATRKQRTAFGARYFARLIVEEFLREQAEAAAKVAPAPKRKQNRARRQQRQDLGAHA